MTKNKTQNICHYVFQTTDALLLDANIWLFIYGPSAPNDSRSRIYSNAFKAILAAHSKIYIDVLITSEFINTYTRIEYSRLGLGIYDNFKRFRQSADFKPIAQAIANTVRRILDYCEPLESGFSTLDIALMLNEYEKGESDFNDAILADLCQRNGLKLVTHDGDFQDCGLTLVTANSYLLA